MRNSKVAQLLKNIGTLLEIKGELIFKVRAYFKASENISNLSENIDLIKKEGRLSQIPGVGKAIEEKIITYLETGSLPFYEKLVIEIPEAILDVIHIPSVGPKKAKLFYDELNIASITELKKACEGGDLLKLPGIKQKVVDNILKGIEVVLKGNEKMNISKATQIAEEILDALRILPEVLDVTTAGSLRRGKEQIGDIDILVKSIKSSKVMDVFLRLPQVQSVNANGESKSSILTNDNVQVDLRVIDPESFGAAQIYFTGSKEFNVKLRQHAIKQEKKVNEYGVYDVSGDKDENIASKTENDCFKALGLPYVPPELREDIGLIDIFEHKAIPRLIEQKDIKGELHVHSTYSDGKNSIEEMVQNAIRMGYSYLAISDHSPKLRVAGGVSVENLEKKRKEIDRLNKKYKDFKVLLGSEVEIDTDGNLDYNEKILSSLDIVIAAVHSHFDQSKDKMTARLIKAVKNKFVNIIAHPTGVHLGKREPYEIDFKSFCQAAADYNVFLEINAFPIRLDLNSSNVYYAREMGVGFAINTDAHRVEHMDYMKHGISVARRGWLTKENVLNTQSCSQLLKSLEK